MIIEYPGDRAAERVGGGGDLPQPLRDLGQKGVGYQEFATADIPSQIQPNNHDEITQEQLKPLKLNGNNQGSSEESKEQLQFKSRTRQGR